MSTPPPPSPPSLAEPTGCCDPLCCRWSFQASYSCDDRNWTVVVTAADPRVACGTDGDWVPGGDACTYTKIMYINGSACGSAPDPGLPFGGAEPEGCCETLCCRWHFRATWGGIDCDTPGWVVVVVDTAAGVFCSPDTAWVNSGDACTFTRTLYTTPPSCASSPDPGLPLGGERPTDCCGTGCCGHDEHCMVTTPGPWCNYVFRAECHESITTFLGGFVEDILPGNYICGTTVFVRINECPPPPGPSCDQCPNDCCTFSPPTPPANPYYCP